MSAAPLTAVGTSAPRDADLAREAFVEGFRRASGTLPGLTGLRRAAIERFADIGFPSVKNEDWKYTSVAPILRARFEPVAAQSAQGTIPQLPFGALKGPRLVFVDGVLSREHSKLSALPKGVTIETLAQALERDPRAVESAIETDPSLLAQPFSALNTAFFRDGAFVRLAPGAVLSEPLQIVNVISDAHGTPFVIAPRVVVQSGEASRLSIIETFVGGQALGKQSAPVLANAVTQLSLSQGAIVEHSLVQLQGPQAFHVSRLSSTQARDSRLTSNFFSVGGAIVRNEINAVLAGVGADCTLNGLYLGRDRQHVDSHTLIDHARPHCASHEYYKGILDGSARAAFTGKVLVRQDSQKTAADQSNKNLLLSETATVNTRPQLQIYADDVKCSHGATVGKLDENAVFYLRSRGIPKVEAKRMLTEAFGVELLERMGSESMRAELAGVIRQWLGGVE